MNIIEEYKTLQTRRQFFSQGKNLLGTAALGSLLGSGSSAAAGEGVVKTHFPATAKRVIYLHMVGGPAQMDLFDHKPKMKNFYDKDLPDSIRKGQRLTTMTSGQKRFPIAPTKFKFSPAGECGMMMNTELLPNLAKKADDICWMRSLHTEAINHEPAIAAMQTGNQVPGRPCLGSWASYGLGSDNENLPAFVVLVAVPSNRDQEQAISSRLWGSGYLPGEHAGVSFRSAGDPILYINNPAGVPAAIRKSTINNINALNEINFEAVGDPETQTRIRQYEMAFKMQASVPELTDLSTESDHTFKLYGEAAKKLGTFANTVLMARRLAERGVRFIQIYHNNWDHHGNVAGRMPSQCKDVDQPCAALIEDLKQRGMFDDTLIIWGGEFGRTIYSQGNLSLTNYGRDHHPRCFSMWMAGGGTKGGTIYGETDDFSYNIVNEPVHIRDFHATVMQLLGYDHEQLSYKYQGLNQRLTGVLPAQVIKELVL
ncbi:MAG: DUF1501 domain-containing protein [Planctomycetaceae bacterium]|mgnify:FL=1|jgi:hypothetical protein|nr:DUF1501 domain-containing protein [Planctomycetaceae bacterium]MBT4726324.1 DUF1501 domain-containing protein [Planctomycetaceae bacterium]MBT4847215.1 DUF1501 domain-containing protein [Planctomycetaceae bacterium]MBT5126600.1 DUF1501 domain-containing protein [Planctomycetaceae bacterium]MBT5598594.1 DUF1501 domain-containing protein [Planctomycetaceae bacterium]